MSEANEVKIVIAGEEFTGWPSVDIDRHIDAFASVGFTAPFEPKNQIFRDTFRPFTFRPMELTVRDLDRKGAKAERIFNGTLVDINPDQDSDSDTVSVTAYALPGVFQNCNAPGAALPMKFNGVTLSQINQAIAFAFELESEFDGEDGGSFAKVRVGVEEKIFSFLAELARQRGRVLSNTADGKLLCWKSVEPGNPVASIREGQPGVKVSAAFNAQDYFSEITGFGHAKKGKKGNKYTVKNQRLSGVLRPMSVTFPDLKPADVKGATEAKLARMFANMASYTLEVATWRDPFGKLWTPNTTLSLYAPGAMIYHEYEFLIRSVSLHQSAETEHATLNLVLPGAFSGQTPETLPWED